MLCSLGYGNFLNFAMHLGMQKIIIDKNIPIPNLAI